MSQLSYFTYPGVGENAAENMHYSQAVRVGDIIECSGQGGWNPLATSESTSTGSSISPDLKTQINQAFLNCEETLKQAGSKGFEDVFSIKSYHVGVSDETLEIMVECLRRFFPNHKPIWTLLGVERLGLVEMKIEIDVRAYVPLGGK